MSADKDRTETITLQGRLVLRTFGRTTKSEHLGVYIVTDKGDFLIRPAGDNPFAHNLLTPLAGKVIRAEGVIVDYVFLAKHWEVVE